MCIRDRRKAFILGIALAAFFRIFFAIIATYLIEIPGILFFGGLLLYFVCWRFYKELRLNSAESKNNKIENQDFSINDNKKLQNIIGIKNLKNKFSDIDLVDWGETPAADVVINVTSLGLKPNDKIDIDYDKIGKDKFFYDVIYKPSKTLFLDEAKKRGNIIENGKMMFAYQAQKAFELWNNLKPEINEQVLNLLDD